MRIYSLTLILTKHSTNMQHFFNYSASDTFLLNTTLQSANQINQTLENQQS